jgi:hypothetical protein
LSRFFDTSCFVQPTPGTFGNSGRNVIVGPGFTSTDFSLFKNIRFKELANLQFRAEFFNSLNQSNYNQPGGGFGPNFGRILTEKHAREIQLALRLSF